MGWRRCRGRSAGTLQMAADGQGFVATGFCRTVETPDFILDAPDDSTVGIFFTIGFVGLLQVVSVTFIAHASLFCV